MRRFVAILGVVATAGVLIGGIRDFDGAHTTVDLFKGLFWIIVGGVALVSFVDDFKSNKWPFGK